jgi:hypothetical protein
MTLRHALLSAGTAVLGCALLAPVALAADGESTPLDLPAAESAKQAAPSTQRRAGPHDRRPRRRPRRHLRALPGPQAVKSAEEQSSGQGLEYTAAAVAATAAEPRLLVAYDDLLSHGIGEARLADFAGLPLPGGSRRRELEAAIEPGLRHHASTLLSTAAER